MTRKITILLILTVAVVVVSARGKIIISTDFPGGNILVLNDSKNKSSQYFEVAGDTVKVRPDLRDTEGEWFYWNFRVSGAAGRKIHFQFPVTCISSYGPAYSKDGGKSWKWLYDRVQSNHNNFVYQFGENDQEVFFSVAIPYLQADFEKFISKYKGNRQVSVGSLTTSEKGRNIERLIIRPEKYKPRYRILVTARHHACEMMASYALEGFIASILEEDDKPMKWLRENVEFFIVPFMDKDGVEDGDQGKNRIPRDHNRDYSGISVHKSTGALRKIIPEWSKRKLIAGIDLHCPGIAGNWHEHIHFVGSEGDKIAGEQNKFLKILIERHQGELRLDPAKALLEFGTSWNVSNTYSKGSGFRSWISGIKGVALAASLELPYSNNNGQQVTDQNARSFGKDLADALSVYLQECQ